MPPKFRARRRGGTGDGPRHGLREPGQAAARESSSQRKDISKAPGGGRGADEVASRAAE